MRDILDFALESEDGGRSSEFPHRGYRVNQELDLESEWVGRVRAGLVSWYRSCGRDLPWRRDRDAYRVLVSETMLVQTTVAAVIPYFARFLERFPDVQALARADEAEVVKAWEGLGYYRRARQLHAAARTIIEEHGGAIPPDPERIAALPGVGRYITGAIASFAFDLPEPIVEANSQRLLARLLAIRGDITQGQARERIWQAAARLVPPSEAGVFNQGLIELGALVCVPREPRCLICPLQALCQARILRLEDSIPEARSRPAMLEVSEACGAIARKQAWLLLQREDGGLWEGFWEFPTIHVAGADPAGRSFQEPVSLSDGLARLTGIKAQIGPVETTIRYTVTRHKVKLAVHRGVASEGKARPGRGFKAVGWFHASELASLTLSSASRRLAVWLKTCDHEA